MTAQLAVLGVVAFASMDLEGTDGWDHKLLPLRCASRAATTGAILLDLLLDCAAEREQSLLDRGRHLADIFDHPPAVLEDPRFPE